MKTPWQRITWAGLFTSITVLSPSSTAAFELSGGVSLGGVVAGTTPHFAVSPHVGVSWRMENGFLVAVHDMCSVMPASKLGVGVYNQTSVAVGYDAERTNFRIGFSLSGYSMPACGATLCGRVVGLSPGAHGQVNVYFAEPFGVSMSVNVDWVGGRSLVLPGGVAVMVVAGPVLRWRSK